MKIAGLIVLFNPPKDIDNKIRSYRRYIDTVFVVDNTVKNLGIATALNIGAREAIAKGYKWLLALDQDSFLSEDAFNKLSLYIENNETSSLGFVAPFACCGGKEEKPSARPYDDLQYCITSGSILNLEAYGKAGPFIDDFFIDAVDIEYSFRLRMNGYRIVRVNDAVLKHKIGNSRVHKFLWMRLESSHHDAWRRFYITRNRLLVMRMYKNIFPEYYKTGLWLTVKEFIYILLFERNKFKKVRSVLRGIVEYFKLRGRYSS
jgi:rhamnosyltransferase